MVDTLISNANSKGLMKSYYGTKSSTQYRTPDFDLNTALKVVTNDPVVKGAMISKVDKILEAKWLLIGKDGRSRKKAAEQKLYDLRFDKFLRKYCYHAVRFNNAFGEIVKQNGKVTDLNVLETIHMDIDADDNGDVNQYIQQIANDSNPITWTPEQVVHLKTNDASTNAWAEVDIEALYDTVLIKDHIRTWINWFFKTNQARGFYNIKNANKEKVKDFLVNLKATERDLSKPVIAQGDIEYQVLRSFADEGKTLGEVLQWCDSQILSLLQIPPIMLGFADQSGRSNSSEQAKPVNTFIKNFHSILEELINNELLPKMGFEKVKFTFSTIDDSSMKTKMEILKMMKDAGMTNEAMQEWMNEQGLHFKTTKLFNEPEDMLLLEKGNDNNDSRDKKGEGEANKQHDTPTTRENQLVAQSEEALDQYKELKEMNKI